MDLPARLAVAPSGTRKRRGPRSWVSRDGLSSLLFLLPMLVIFGFFAWFPIVRDVVMSFQRTNLIDTPKFVGLDNFAAVLNDPLFGKSIGNTIYFSVLALVFGYPLPLILAVIISEARRYKGLLSALAYVPVVIPPVVSVLLWTVFYNASPTGLFNTVLSWVGIGAQPWLQNKDTVMPSIVIESTWANAGATMIIYMAALLSVPRELYDAASVDGASILQKIWHVTLPQLRGVLLITMILQLIATAQVFTEPYLFTGGGPANSTMTVLFLIYHYAFQNSLGGDYGMAAALSIMLALFLAAFTAIYLWLTRSWSTNS